MLDIADALVGSVALGGQIGQFDRDDLRLAVRFCAEAKLGFRQIVQARDVEQMRALDALFGERRGIEAFRSVAVYDLNRAEKLRRGGRSRRASRDGVSSRSRARIA